MITDIKTIIDLFSKGEMIILVDDEERENEGDLVISSKYLTADHINFMITYGKGLVCAPISSTVAKKLKLPLMEGVHNEMQTPYTHSVDLKGDGVTTGISAEDRFKTIKGLANSESTRDSFNIPGHIFPLQAMDGGVLRRAGHTEAAVDLCTISQHEEVAVICEIINEDGTMARFEDLIKFSKSHQLPIGTIKDLIQFRLDTSNPVEFISKSKIPTDYGEFTAHVYKDNVDNTEHIALTFGDYLSGEDTMVRVHSECLTGDTLFSNKCDCGSQLSNALKTISENESGVLLYMRGHEGRGIGLGNKIKAYSLQEDGDDTVDANLKLGFKNDQRDYGTGALILRNLGISNMNLLTNNPSKRAGLEGYGLIITKRTPLIGQITPENTKYLETKKDKMGHNFNEE
ncbi:MAG: GTP cyclohydrolase II [Candidatus Actinomarina sp.]|jgi:3,4-dihydroxy 2-butanone 4-phosphate synthase/GTP cyclohydrolase II|tara:strand:- start:1001 stop:2203 length:1203 start_codon:yes stop_codon:yes gene_type:complete